MHKKKDSLESGLPIPYFNSSGMSVTLKFASYGYVCAKLLNSHFRSYKLLRIHCISPSLVGAVILLSIGNKLIVM